MEKQRTINGQTFKTVLEKLKMPLEFVAKHEQNGKHYLLKDLVDERADEVLGLNYSFKLTAPPTIVSSGKGNRKYFVGAGEIIIYDDTGNFVCSRSAGGGDIITILSNGDKAGETKDMSDDYQACISYIKKKCLKELGLGRYLSLNEKVNTLKKKNLLLECNEHTQRTDNKPLSKSSSNNSKNDVADKPVRLQLLSKATSGNSFIKFQVLNKQTSTGGELYIWNSKIDSIGKENINKFKNYPINTIFNAIVKQREYKGTMALDLLRFVA
ncbi:MAG: hypothetical protein MJA82_14445 [Clostridia bacterium]|nr:hypothetical protein [Clostridia bacterium]